MEMEIINYSEEQAVKTIRALADISIFIIPIPVKAS